jgi:hypothetical protein
MITDEELGELPSDPELAFVALEKILRTQTESHEARAPYDEYNPDPFRLEYMIKILAAAQIYGIEGLSGLQVPRANEKDIEGYFRQFVTDVDFVCMQIRIRTAQVNREGSVALDAKAKRKIHHYIQQIRDAIEDCGLDVDKKDALLGKLAKFAAEVDRTRTNLNAGMAVFIAVCAGIGEGFDKLKPVREMIDSIAGLLGKAKELEDQYTPRLPAPQEQKKIEARKPQAPMNRKPTTGGKYAGELDDDIPF